MLSKNSTDQLLAEVLRELGLLRADVREELRALSGALRKLDGMAEALVQVVAEDSSSSHEALALFLRKLRQVRDDLQVHERSGETNSAGQ
jgi:ABC-type transporter Mla subunit MlaD